MKNDQRIEWWQWVIEATAIFAASLVWLAVTMPGCKTLNPADWIPPALTNAVPPVVPPTTVPATTTTQPAVATGDAIAPESIRTKGSRANLRPQDARIKPGLNLTVRHTARGIAFDYAPHGWTGGETVARIYCAYQVGGEWIGGQWDDVRPGQKFKERKNLTGFADSRGHAEGPRFGVAPPDGATVVYWLSNLANTERTEIVVAVNKWGER